MHNAYAMVCYTVYTIYSIHISQIQIYIEHEIMFLIVMCRAFFVPNFWFLTFIHIRFEAYIRIFFDFYLIYFKLISDQRLFWNISLKYTHTANKNKQRIFPDFFFLLLYYTQYSEEGKLNENRLIILMTFSSVWIA